MTHKCCSKCEEDNPIESFGLRGNICRDCRNSKRREQYKTYKGDIIENTIEIKKNCSKCEEDKPIEKFYTKRGSSICRDCNNLKRREKYNTNEEHRQKLIAMSCFSKHEKVIKNQKLREEHQIKIGIDNKTCGCCNVIKDKDRFRHNRLKCKDCERDDPIDKLKRVIRSRIFSALTQKNKHTIEYLGCNTPEYLKWLLNNDSNYTLENRGKKWHIDHVIPLSHFNLENDEEQLIAFNWRNTMPLSAKENLSKNNKIIKSQIEQHYKSLEKYHIENNLDLPQVFIDLFAKHLDDGKFLKLSLPLTSGNICEELG
jgi:hypothetical protein